MTACYHRRIIAMRSVPKKQTLSPRPAEPSISPLAEKGQEWRRHAMAIGALWIALLLVYANSFTAGLIGDNAPLIVRDARVHDATAENLHLIWTTEYWYTQQGNGIFRPLTTLSYLFNYAILGNGERPAGYHWVNYLLHALNATLLYLLALKIFQRKILPSFALAMLWAVHPVLTESVTNVIGRADLIADFAMLAALLCYLRGRDATGWRMWVWLPAAGLACAVGMFSKEISVIIPLVAVTYDLAFPSASPLRNRLTGYAAMALPCALFFLARPAMAPWTIPFPDNPLTGASFLTARVTALKVLGKYIWLLLFPLTLSSDYSYNEIPLFTWSFRSWEDWQAVVALADVALIAALAVWGWRRDRRVFFFIVLAALGMGPTANMAKLIGTIMAERFLYVPAIGFAGCAVIGIMALSRRFSADPARFTAGVIGVLCLVLGVRTFVRNMDWQDERSISAAQLHAVPNSYKARAFVYGTLDESIRNVDVALAILNPLPDAMNTPVAYINAGKWYREKGQSLAQSAPGESAAWYQKSLDALLHGERILKAANQNHLQVYEQLGQTYMQLGQYSEAIQALDKVRRKNFSEELTRQLSLAYFRSGDLHRAEITLWEALLVYPDNRRIAGWLVDTYRRSDPQSCAVQADNAGASVNLKCPLVREQACAAAVNAQGILREGGQEDAAAKLRDGAASEFGCGAAK